MFCCMIVLGTLLGISSGDWLGVWLGLEINLFSVLPLFLGGSLASEAESAAKYFLVQAIGSSLLLNGALINLNYNGTMFVSGLMAIEVSMIMGVIGLMVKVGLIPFHFWVPSVMAGVSWEACFILSVWQKVGPLLVLVSFIEGPMMQVLVVSGCAGSLVGGLGGFAQTQVRAMLGYSSINHSGWLVVGSMYSITSAVMYFFIYLIITGFLFYFLSVVEVNSYTGLLKGFSGVSVKLMIILSLSLLTLAGLPPTVGFSMKWAVFLGVVSAKGFLAMSVLVVGTLLSLYYYICMSFCWYVFSSSTVWGSLEDSPFGGVSVAVLMVLCGYLSFLVVAQLCV